MTPQYFKSKNAYNMKRLLIIIALCYTQTILGQTKEDKITVSLEPLTTKSIDPVCRMRLRRGAVDSIDYKGIGMNFCLNKPLNSNLIKNILS